MRPAVSACSAAAPGARFPEILEQERDGDRASLELAVPESLVWFAGHFPGHPVLPGVAQVGWAARCAREVFGFSTDPLRIDRVKFLKPVRPGEHLGLELWRDGARPDRVEWRFARGDVACSRGRFEFAAGP